MKPIRRNPCANTECSSYRLCLHARGIHFHDSACLQCPENKGHREIEDTPETARENMEIEQLLSALGFPLAGVEHSWRATIVLTHLMKWRKNREKELPKFF